MLYIITEFIFAAQLANIQQFHSINVEAMRAIQKFINAGSGKHEPKRCPVAEKLMIKDNL